MKSRSINILNRNSGTELLRIICMFLIVTAHYGQYGTFESINLLNIDAKHIFVQELMNFGRVSCAMFAMITGYYMVKKECNHMAIVISRGGGLILKMTLYSICCCLVVKKLELYPVSNKDVIKSFFPYFYGNWYAASYVLFYFFIPYINKMILCMEKNEYKRLLVIFSFFYSIVPTVCFFMPLEGWWRGNFGNLGFFIFMYLIGAYINLHKENDLRFPKYLYLLIGLLGMLLLICITLLIDFVGVKIQSDKLIKNANYFCEYNMLPSLLMSVPLFMFFISLNFHNRIINTISKCMFGVYLIHIDNLMKHVIFVVPFKWLDFGCFYLESFIKIVLVFVLCAFIDFFYNNTLGKGLNVIINKIGKLLYIKIPLKNEDIQ